MKKAILTHNDFGIFKNIQYLLNNLSHFDKKPINDIKTFINDKNLEFPRSIDALIDFLLFIGVISVSKEKLINNINKFSVDVSDTPGLKFFLIDQLFVQFKKQNMLQQFITFDSIRYDAIDDEVKILNVSIPLIYSGIRNLLYELGLFQRSEKHFLISINPLYQEFFIEKIIYWINDKTLTDLSSPLSFEKFLELQRRKEKAGYQAEQYVLNYELCRLSNHLQKAKIKIISRINVGAGYDIISYNNSDSPRLDRFIEVKSYSHKMRFYWTKNEISVAEVKGHNYFLYLVDREKSADPKYEPTIIQNPYLSIFENNIRWEITPEIFLINRNNY